ncbi:MAG: hypothetical protein CMP24_07355 [Rickettsiales bacterium]|nr:hypothetical protein [Rickettsiales bacterium]
MDYKIISSIRNFCGESPVWMPLQYSLYWTDIDGKILYKKDFNSNNISSVKMPGRVSCIAPIVSGGFIIAIENKLVKLDQFFKNLEVLTEVFPYDSNVRLNDGKADRSGNYFWVGSIFLPRNKKKADLWRFSANGEIKKIVGNITTSNGLSWSPCGTIMYHADSWSSKIWRYDYDLTKGEISNKTLFYSTNKEQGRPDGACVDENGFYWSACFDGGRILRISPDGILDKEIFVPMEKPTMPAFGGNDMKTLLVTSHGGEKLRNVNSGKKECGRVISIQTKIKGINETLFKI